MRYLKGALVFIYLILLSACKDSILLISGVNDEVGTQVAQTQTASAWTATPVTPSPTTVPDKAKIVNLLNDNIRNADKLAELVEAEYYVAKVEFIASGNPNYYTTMRIEVICESLLQRTCTPERGFVILMNGFKSVYGNDKQRDDFSPQVPQTIQTLDVIVELVHAGSIGKFTVGWNNVKAFARGNLSPEQFDHEIIVRP